MALQKLAANAAVRQQWDCWSIGGQHHGARYIYKGKDLRQSIYGTKILMALGVGSHVDRGNVMFHIAEFFLG